MAHNTNASVRPFGIRDKIGYMFGDFGNDFTFILSSTFLMKFYTDVMGVEGWIVGVVYDGCAHCRRFHRRYDGPHLRFQQDDSRRQIQTVDPPYVRPCGDRLIPDLPERFRRHAHELQNRLAVCYIHSVGIHFLHFYQYPLRLDGVCYLG